MSISLQDRRAYFLLIECGEASLSLLKTGPDLYHRQFKGMFDTLLSSVRRAGPEVARLTCCENSSSGNLLDVQSDISET